MKKLLAVAALVGSMGVMSAHAAMLVPTGGTLNHMTPDSIPAAYGEFSSEYQVTVSGYLHSPYEWTTELATLGHLEGSYSESSLQISGEAHMFDGDVMMTPGTVSGQLGFDLTESTLLRFSLSQSSAPFWNADPGVTVTLLNAAGDVELGCIGRGYFYGVSGGCRVGSQPIQWDNEQMPHEGAIHLAAGHYELSFYGVTSSSVGVPLNSDFSFGLTTVPIPGTAWLLASGLGLLARRRRVSRGE